jgi:inosine/xanthosine triphosphatase
MESPAALRVIVASSNPVKVRATQSGFELMFPRHVAHMEGLEVPSAVSSQPRTDSETLHGAEARTTRARESVPTADFWVGIEGGIDETVAGMAAYAWVVVESRDAIGRARTGAFFLPEAVAQLVRDGVELGAADDLVFGHTDSKRKMGAVGLLTQGALDREALYAHAVALALIPFLSPDLYPRSDP